MRICVVNNTRPNLSNRMTNNLYSGLKESGVETVMLTCQNVDDFSEDDGVVYFDFGFDPSVLSGVNEKEIINQYIYMVSKYLMKNKFDFVYFGDRKIYNVFLNVTDFDVEHTALTVYEKYDNNEYYNGMGGNFISLSEKHMLSSGGVSCDFIYNGLSFDGLKSHLDPHVPGGYYLYNDEISYRSGFNHILELLDVCDIDIKIMGDIYYGDDITKDYDLDEYFNRENIEYLGFVREKDVYYGVLSGAKANITPNTMDDPSGIFSTMDSIFAKTPVLISESGPSKEIYGGFGVGIDKKKFGDSHFLIGILNDLENTNMDGSLEYVLENFSRDTMVKEYIEYAENKIGRY